MWWLRENIPDIIEPVANQYYSKRCTVVRDNVVVEGGIPDIIEQVAKSGDNNIADSVPTHMSNMRRFISIFSMMSIRSLF